MIKNVIVFVIVCTSMVAQDLPVMTPYKQIPLTSVLIDQPVKYRGVLPSTARVNVPEGFTVSVFYAGAALKKPRFMEWSPDGVLHIADLDARSIYALPDRNDDGIADTIIAVATNVTAHSIAFYRGDLYAAQERSVVRLQDLDNDGRYETRSDFIAPIAEGATQPGGGHTTRTILFDTVRSKVYLSIGSLCNVCRSEKPGDTDYQRALIEEWNADGTGRKTYATGARNAVGLLLRGGRVWASNNGSDSQGNDVPPEWIDVVRDGGFYGYPYAHSHGIFFPLSTSSPSDYRALLPLTAKDSANVVSMVQPAALIQAHSAPMALVSAHPSMPQTFRNGMFVALRGSWNRTPATGGKIIYLDFDNENDTTANYTADFLTGFMTDSTRSSGWGWARPVGLTVDAKGRLYVGSDANTRFILTVTPVKSTSVDEGRVRDEERVVCESNGDLVVHTGNTSAVRHVLVYDVRGDVVGNCERGSETGGQRIVFPDLPHGVYFVTLHLNDGTVRSLRGIVTR
jgi:glucose/arabinose dehydrogenase